MDGCLRTYTFHVLPPVKLLNVRISVHLFEFWPRFDWRGFRNPRLWGRHGFVTDVQHLIDQGGSRGESCLDLLTAL